MSTLIEMVYSACVHWFDDLVSTYPWPIHDEYDASRYFEEVVKDATKLFLEYGFHTPRARNDAMMILRALFYEHYKFQKAVAQHQLNPDPTVKVRLESAPQTTQKSAAWHAESYDTLSGHEFGSICVGGPGEKEAIYVKKCNPPPPMEMTESRTVYLTPEDGALNPFKWGWRYEPVARDIFAKHYAQGDVVDTLGRIRHPTLPRLGASPDGLVTTGPRVGRLVELKCPSSRILDGKIPLRYYCQMQLQAEVCDVVAVEYFECALAAVPVLLEEHLNAVKLPYVGKILVLGDEEGKPKEYVYSPVYPATKQGINDANAFTIEGKQILESSCWYVKDSYTDTVLRNKRWWNEVGKPAYTDFWLHVDASREDGRYKQKSVPLFIEDTTTEGSVGSNRVVHDSEDEVDETANDEDEVDTEKNAEVESDEELDQSLPMNDTS